MNALSVHINYPTDFSQSVGKDEKTLLFTTHNDQKENRVPQAIRCNQVVDCVVDGGRLQSNREVLSEQPSSTQVWKQLKKFEIPYALF